MSSQILAASQYWLDPEHAPLPDDAVCLVASLWCLWTNRGISVPLERFVSEHEISLKRTIVERKLTQSSWESVASNDPTLEQAVRQLRKIVELKIIGAVWKKSVSGVVSSDKELLKGYGIFRRYEEILAGFAPARSLAADWQGAARDYQGQWWWFVGQCGKFPDDSLAWWEVDGECALRDVERLLTHLEAMVRRAGMATDAYALLASFGVDLDWLHRGRRLLRRPDFNDGRK